MDARVETGMAAQNQLRSKMLAGGAKQIGWKSAFGTPAAMQKMGTDYPAVGFMTDRNVLQPGATVDVSDWTQPVIEMEMAVFIGTDLPDGLADAAAAAKAIAGLAPAFELVDPTMPMADADKLLADILGANIFHRNVVFGPMDASLAGGATDSLRGLITHNDNAPVEIADVTANSGAPAEVVAGVANHLLEIGEHLKKGDVIICGSIMPPIFAAAGDSVTYELAPFDAMTVTLA